MQLTVVTHVYNESFLLPFWLKHHRELFDHGVIIDYHSTDGSVEICRELCPDWEVVASRDDLFYAEGCDRQVMEQEQRFPDWKMALNITEFLFCRDLRDYLDNFDREIPGVAGAWTRTFMMVDRLEDRSKPVDPELPLVLQRYHGLPAPNGWGRERLIHRCADGSYAPGRHRSYLTQNLPRRDDLLLLWFNYSPYDLIKGRKLQIQKQLPQSDIDLGRGHHHIRTEEQLDAEFLEAASRTTNLWDDPAYQSAFEPFWLSQIIKDEVVVEWSQ